MSFPVLNFSYWLHMEFHLPILVLRIAHKLHTWAASGVDPCCSLQYFFYIPRNSKAWENIFMLNEGFLKPACKWVALTNATLIVKYRSCVTQWLSPGSLYSTKTPWPCPFFQLCERKQNYLSLNCQEPGKKNN